MILKKSKKPFVSARNVDSGGTLSSSSACYGSGGVRPALYVEPGIEVELEKIAGDEVYLSPSALFEGFTTRQLVEELFRRAESRQSLQTP